MNNNLIEILQSYCDRLNQYLPCKTQEDVDNLADILSEFFENVEGSALYWSREIYIDSGINTNTCTWILTHRECHFVPSDDLEEHLGIMVKYDYEDNYIKQ